MRLLDKHDPLSHFLALVMLDLEDPTKIIGRTKDFIMEPEYNYEKQGYYKGCVFPTGNMIIDGKLFVYYGAADKYIGLATCNANELIDFILSDEQNKK
jgi:predicted GH43/DUF377 family glycosyl hydrolase